MKKYYLILLLTASLCGLTACNISQPADLGPRVYFYEPARICDRLNTFVYDSKDHKITPSEMTVSICWESRLIPYHSTAEEYQTWLEPYVPYRNKVDAEIVKAYGEYPNECWSYVYTNVENIKLSADKVLFGREAGSDLSDKFRVVSYGGIYSSRNPAIFSFPECNMLYGFDDVQSFLLSEWDDVCGLMQSITIKYDEVPNETYSDVTFHYSQTIVEDRVLWGEFTVNFVEK